MKVIPKKQDDVFEKMSITLEFENEADVNRFFALMSHEQIIREFMGKSVECMDIREEMIKLYPKTEVQYTPYFDDLCAIMRNYT